MNGPFAIPEQVAQRLREAMLEPRDLQNALAATEPESRTTDGRRLRLRPRLAVCHPLDPEFSEIRQLEVVLVRDESGWTVETLDGLDPEELAAP